MVELTDEEIKIQRKLKRIFKEMKNANLCIFVDDGTLRVFRGKHPPMTRQTGEQLGLDNEQSIMDFFGLDYCNFDGGAF